MMPKPGQLMEGRELEFVQQVNVLFKSIDTLTFSDALNRLKVIESHFLGIAETETERLEIRRRILEDAVRFADFKDASFEETEELLARLDALGYSDAALRLSFIGAYARRCLDAGRPELVPRHLSEALTAAREVTLQTDAWAKLVSDSWAMLDEARRKSRG